MIDKIINDLQRIADRKCYPEDILDGSIAQEWVDYLTNLQQENKQLKEKIKHADEFCDRYMSVRLELFDMYELLNKIRKILGDEE